ncbi:MAG: RES family NAD+ phosphorylase [Rhodoferax sp.]|nr:RES family NAD+ phosphorylase [Rhodoferax sp.]
MRLWRIATETRTYRADDLSGRGAAAHPGRWNDDGQAVVYCAPSIAMAVLETAAHIDTTGLPLNRFLVAIDVPESAWAARTILTPATMPVAWRAIPAGSASVTAGSRWWAGGASAILEVPSAIVPEEPACVLNPNHAGAAAFTATVVRAFEYDLLFRA